MNGTIFDIREFTVHDGPGPRITVFLKGCPLRCRWCHNPEGLSTARQLMYKKNFCTHCGACMKPCEHPECLPFGRCVHACANGCLSIAGEEISAEHLAQRLRKRGEILKRMDGGITISGGEPMLQADFVCALVQELGDFHKAIQTSGYAEPETYQKVIGCMDYVMQDIKLADTQAHIRYTGVSNARILENIAWLKASGKDFVFRVPLIPGITDTEENLRAKNYIKNGQKESTCPKTDALVVLNSDRFSFAQLTADIPSAINHTHGVDRAFGFVRVIENEIVLDREAA